MRASTRLNQARTSPKQAQHEAHEHVGDGGKGKEPVRSRRRAANTRRGTMTTHACLACRDKRTKCDGKNPCDRCRRRGVECNYVGKPWTSKGCLREQTESLRKHLRQREMVLQALASQANPLEIVQWLRNGDSIESICANLEHRAARDDSAAASSAVGPLLDPEIEPDLLDVFGFGAPHDLHITAAATGGGGSGSGSGSNMAHTALAVTDQSASSLDAGTGQLLRDASSTASSYSAASGMQSDISPPTQAIPPEPDPSSEAMAVSMADMMSAPLSMHANLQGPPPQRQYEWSLDDLANCGQNQVDYDQQSGPLYSVQWTNLGDPNFQDMPPM